MRENFRETLRFVVEDFASFPRVPIVLGLVLALPAAVLAAPALAGPAFALGLLLGMARESYSPFDR